MLYLSVKFYVKFASVLSYRRVTNGRTDEWTDSTISICDPNFLRGGGGGHKKEILYNFHLACYDSIRWCFGFIRDDPVSQ